MILDAGGAILLALGIANVGLVAVLECLLADEL